MITKKQYVNHKNRATKKTCFIKRAVQVILSAAVFFYQSDSIWAGPIDTARLLAAGRDSKNWLIFGHDYTNQRYVALDQINTRNVQSLTLRWKFSTGIREAFQTTPLVADGV